MGKSHKRTKRGDQYHAMAAGYSLLKSPLADSYRAAAEHYRDSDPPLDQPAGSSAQAPEKSEAGNGSG
ncbi:MAG TPA: hypothetical protein VG291_05575 [Xanthobacteraceae bacterium]|jgi:hypothetical protein|nr:hypothetical protein [Xanthobacteraceae bacterium]